MLGTVRRGRQEEGGGGGQAMAGCMRSGLDSGDADREKRKEQKRREER